jgi:hypothetical protein
MDYDKLLYQLEKDINKIPNKKERQFSLDALEHKRRYKNDLRTIKNYFESGKILDIGSSPYHLIYCLHYLNYDAYGVDILPEHLKQFHTTHKLKIKKCNIEEERLPFKDNEFGMVIFSEVF